MEVVRLSGKLVTTYKTTINIFTCVYISNLCFCLSLFSRCFLSFFHINLVSVVTGKSQKRAEQKWSDKMAHSTRQIAAGINGPLQLRQFFMKRSKLPPYRPAVHQTYSCCVLFDTVIRQPNATKHCRDSGYHGYQSLQLCSSDLQTAVSI
jgi:hypothetical protein